MLPSFRLIAVTFFCGFTVVFAALHFAKFLHSAHQSVPVTAAQIAAPSPTVIPDRELRRGQASVPVMYDMRFATVTAAPQSAGTSPVASRHMTTTTPQIVIPYTEEETLSETGPKTEPPAGDEVVTVASVEPVTTGGAAQRSSNDEPSTQSPSEVTSAIGPNVVMPIPPPRPRLATLRVGEDLPGVVDVLPRPRGQSIAVQVEPAKPRRIRRPIAPAPQRDEFYESPFNLWHNSAR